MDEEMFQEILDSIEEAGEISRDEKLPAREWYVDENYEIHEIKNYEEE